MTRATCWGCRRTPHQPHPGNDQGQGFRPTIVRTSPGPSRPRGRLPQGLASGGVRSTHGRQTGQRQGNRHHDGCAGSLPAPTRLLPCAVSATLDAPATDRSRWSNASEPERRQFMTQGDPDRRGRPRQRQDHAAAPGACPEVNSVPRDAPTRPRNAILHLKAGATATVASRGRRDQERGRRTDSERAPGEAEQRWVM